MVRTCLLTVMGDYDVELWSRRCMYDRYETRGLSMSAVLSSACIPAGTALLLLAHYSLDQHIDGTHHELNHVDPKMFILHGIQAQTRLSQSTYHLRIRRVRQEFYIVLYISAILLPVLRRLRLIRRSLP